MSSRAASTIVRSPRRATVWPGSRKFAAGLAGGNAGAGWALVAADPGSSVRLLFALVATVLTVDAVAGFPLWFALYGSRRYLLWTVRCRRGRRCADLRVAEYPVSYFDVTPPLLFRLAWRCESCGTEYERVQELPTIRTSSSGAEPANGHAAR